MPELLPVEEVQMTPEQSNEVILAKLESLGPAFEMLLSEFIRLKTDLANGLIHWDQILARHLRDDDP